MAEDGREKQTSVGITIEDYMKLKGDAARAGMPVRKYVRKLMELAALRPEVLEHAIAPAGGEESKGGGRHEG